MGAPNSTPEPDPNNKKACEQNADNRDRPPSGGTGQKIVDTDKEYGGDQNAPKDQKPGIQASHALNLVSTTQDCLISWFEILSRPPGDRSRIGDGTRDLFVFANREITRSLDLWQGRTGGRLGQRRYFSPSRLTTKLVIEAD